ncbi:MAG: hypothetical protein J7500_16505 [Sphingomonas sp.]|uniref:hypothetical protein n=1 Tax=Sphingomonas sp. TaxID=28214 RepID=UPI001B018932|nr:hypothetical protein [Sphingomonas sp.]MBO9624312.1 hypothetical protein [Sphingomonas sp.]
MPKPATELMQEILFSVFLDSVDALKRASNGLPNQLVRDLNAIHRNTTFADLPKDVQDAIVTNVRAAFTKLLKEGYSVGPTSAVRPAQPAAPHGPGARRGPARGRPGGEGPRRPPSGDGPRRPPSGDGPRRPPRDPKKPRG